MVWINKLWHFILVAIWMDSQMLAMLAVVAFGWLVHMSGCENVAIMVSEHENAWLKATMFILFILYEMKWKNREKCKGPLRCGFIHQALSSLFRHFVQHHIYRLQQVIHSLYNNLKRSENTTQASVMESLF